MKYTRLTKEQFEELHQEFINFLATQSITADEWKNLKENKFAYYLALIAPVSLISLLIPIIFDNFPGFIKPLEILLKIYIVFMIINILMSASNALGDRLRMNETFKYRPIESYLQVIKIILYLFGAIAVFSQLTGKDPVAFFSIMGAASAVLLLMFKDTIMGFVASIQVTINDMVRIGDWIEMPKYNADGDVIEINLNTFKIQNWDKTITTVPTHYLVTVSFKNWRGMQETGGRRIKRSINIKIASIRFTQPEEIDELKKIQLLAPYIDERLAEINAYNEQSGADRDMPINGRNLTNIGLFRQYVFCYLRSNPKVKQDMTLLVRQLQPTEHGVPLELYLFSADIRWAYYEELMSDIFDHLFAAIKFFDLDVFEAPASDDVRYLINNDSNEQAPTNGPARH